MSQLKKLAGDTVWYGVSSILGRVLNYLLTPLYTGIFLPGDFGIMTELYAYVAFFNVIYIYGMETAYFRFATRHKGDQQSYFNLSVSTMLLTSLGLSLALSLMAHPITNALGYSGQEQIVYWLAAIMAIDSIFALPFAKLRLLGKPRRFATIRMTTVIVTILLNLFFLVFCQDVIDGKYMTEHKGLVETIYQPGFAVQYVFLSNLLANSLLVVLLASQFKGFRFTFDRIKFKPMLVYGLPIMIMSIAATTNEMLSRALLKYVLPEGFYAHLTNMEALGIFGSCYKLSIFMMLGVQAFRYAAEPFFFSKAEQSDSPELFSNVMKGFVIFNSVVFLAVTVNLEVLGVIFLRNPVYREGIFIVPFLLMGYFFFGIFYNLSVWFKITDKTKYGAIITAAGAVITIVLNLFLIPILGYFGSALATLFTYFFMCAFNYYYGQKHHPIPYKTGNAFFYIILSSTLGYLFYIIDIENVFLNIVLKNSAVLLLALIIYVMERKHIKGKKVFGWVVP